MPGHSAEFVQAEGGNARTFSNYANAIALTTVNPARRVPKWIEVLVFPSKKKKDKKEKEDQKRKGGVDHALLWLIEFGIFKLSISAGPHRRWHRLFAFRSPGKMKLPIECNLFALRLVEAVNARTQPRVDAAPVLQLACAVEALKWNSQIHQTIAIGPL